MVNISVAYNYAMVIMNHYKSDLIGLYNCFRYLNDVLSKRPLLCDVLSNYYISAKKKEDMFFEVFDDLGHYGSIFHFIFKNKRYNYIPSIIDCFLKIYRKENNIGNAEIVSSVKLSDANLAKISDFLKKEFNLNDVILSFRIDPSLISGFLIYFDDKVLDLSIKGFLNNLEHRILKNSF